MISGRVKTALEAVVSLQVCGPKGQQSTIEAVIDIGFTDYLTLPRTVIDLLQLSALDTMECQLADGSLVWMNGFVVMVQWDGAPREILALATEGGLL